MINVTPPPRSPRSQLVPGILLMLVGGCLLLVNLGFGLPFSLWHYLPVPFIAAGVWGVSFPSRHLSRSGGVWSLCIGLYLACGMFGLFGLGWGTAWPIFIIGAGLGVILGRDQDCPGRRHRVIHGA